jgi:hypothetical protein
MDPSLSRILMPGLEGLRILSSVRRGDLGIPDREE